MTVLVTGHLGFIGHNVTRRLSALGLSWRGFDLIERLPLPSLEGVDVLLHLAAHADVRHNWDSRPERDTLFARNVYSLVHLLEECVGAKDVRRVVFASTGAVYGDAMGVPQHENTYRVATSPYAASKLAGEAFVQAYAHAQGWRWYCARLSAVVGHGYRHGHLMDVLEQHAATGRFVGRDRGDPKSMVHVEDVVDALVLMATGDVPSGVYNVSSAETWSWRDSARVAGVPFEYPAAVERGWVGDGTGTALSVGKLRPWWEAQRTIESGVRDALADLRAR